MTFLVGVVIALLGATVASFVGVIVERINTGASWANDRSRCDSCMTTLTARDLIPMVSWVMSLGKCRTCGSKIPARHVIVEGLVALAFFTGYVLLGPTPLLFVFLVALAFLLFIVLYDLRHTIVPMKPLLAFILFALIFRVMYEPIPHEFGTALLFAGIASAIFLLFHILSKGKAMGLGDAPVVLGLSLLVGPLTVVPGVLFSFWIGAIYGMVVLAQTPRGHRMGIEVPFVPFLALGFLLAYATGWNPLPLF